MDSARSSDHQDSQQEIGAGDKKARAASAVRELGETATGKASEERASEIEERWEQRLAWPVLIAAIVSVPAVFLTLFDEPLEMIGHVGLWAATVVLVAETIILFLVSPKKMDWLRRNWWLVGLTIAAVIAVVFSIGPMQLFRLLRSVGALRVLRAKQVAKAGESLGKKGRSEWRKKLGKILATFVVATFVVIALVDPDSEARTFLEDFVGEDGVIYAAIGAGLLTLGGMYFLVREPKAQESEEGAGNSESESS